MTDREPQRSNHLLYMLGVGERLAGGRIYYGWYIVGVAFIVGVVRVGFTGVLFGIFLKPMSEEFGWSRATTTGAVTIGTLLAAFIAWGVGYTLDRYGSRIVVVVSTVLLGGAYMALSAVQGVASFYVAYAFGRSIMQAALGDSIVATIVSKWFVRRRGRAVALAALGHSVGGAVLAIVAQLIIDDFGWRMAWMMLALLTWAALIIPAALFLRRTPEDLGLRPDGDRPETRSESSAPSQTTAPTPAAASGEVGLTLRQALHTPSFWLLSLVVGMAAIASTGVTFHQVAHFTDVGISATVAASTSSVFTLVQTGSVFASGFVAERVGPRVAVLVTILIIMVGVYRIWHVGSAAEAYIAAAIFGIGLGAYGTLINLLWADYFGREYLGSIRGVSLFFQLVGNAGGSLISAAVFDLTGSYSGAFTGVLIMDAAIVVMLLMARRPHQQRVTATASGEARPG